MVFIRLGGEKVEGFYFHNNWKVQVDYGMNMTEIQKKYILKCTQWESNPRPLAPKKNTISKRAICADNN